MGQRVLVVRGPFRGAYGLACGKIADAAGRSLYWVRFARGGGVEALLPKDALRRPCEPPLVHPAAREGGKA